MKYKLVVNGWWKFLETEAQLKAQAATDFPGRVTQTTTQVVDRKLEITVRVVED